jgi:TrmH family RNA methyltransferase
MTDVSRLPRLGAAAKAALAAAVRGQDGFLLEGPKAIADALRRPGVRVRSVWIAAERAPAGAADVLEAAQARGVPVGTAPARDLERASGTVTPQGALAVVEDAAVDARAVLAGAGPALLLDGVQDPGNVGAIFRVAAAFDAAGVLADEATAHPLGLKALRASAGTALAVPYARAPLPALLAAVRESRRPLWLLDGGGTDLFSVAAPPPGVVLAVGSEGSGAGAAVRAAAALRVGIPISPRVESLNAAVAAGIAVAALVRRR